MATRARGDELGLIWEAPVAAAKGEEERFVASPAAIAKLDEMVTWKPPELSSIRLDGVKELCVDVETKDTQLSELGAGVRRPGNYIAGIAVGTTDRRWYLPVAHEGGGNLPKEMVFGWARKVLNAFDGDLIGANLIYDLDWLANEGITFPNVKAMHDVQIAEPLIDEWRMHYDLDSLGFDYLGEGKNETLLQRAAMAYGFGQTDSSIKTNLWRLPARFVGPYAEADVDLPIRIWHKQRVRLAEEGLLRVYDVERRLIPLLLAMKRRGVRVDLDKAKQVTDMLRKQLKELESALRREFGSGATFTSPGSLVRGLEEAGIKLPPTPKTAHLPERQQRKSVNKVVLDKYKDHPRVKLLLEGRKLQTLIGTFMEGHIQSHHINGVIHCDFNQLKGDTGGTIARFSSSNPNLQNIPARDEQLAPMIRGIFVPFTERWDRYDESQIEYRLLANFARGQGAEGARQKYRDDPETDFHVMCGEFIGADANDGFIRKRVKNTNFCKVYGGGVPKLAATFGCSIEEAQEFADRYDRELPWVKATLEAAMHWAGRRGFVETLLGRKQRFSLWEPFGNYDRKFPPLPEKEAREKYGNRIQRAFLYAALNRKLQASAADVMKKAMVDCWEAGVFADDALGAPLLTVHDELDIDNPMTPKAMEAAVEVKRLMEVGFVDELKVPLVCDHSFGNNWGEAS